MTRLSFRLLDVAESIRKEMQDIKQGKAHVTAAEDAEYFAQRLARLRRLFVYVDARMTREWKRRPFCFDCGADEPDHRCEAAGTDWLSDGDEWFN